MPRYALKIEYDGAPFCGWQRQPNQHSVQGAIEAALAKLESRDHNIAAAGRTDTGVHSLGQVAHCDMDRDWDPFRLSEALNFHLKPLPVAIVACAQVSDDWHARFSAMERRYLFRMVVRRAPLVLETGKVWQVAQKMDVAAMQAGADRLLGRHDFTTFRSTVCQANSPLRTLDALDVEQVARVDGAQEIRFHVRARSFLHNQVRSFVGTLERVGAGAWAPEDVTVALEARDRGACGPVCAPNGLYFESVGYPEDPFV